MPGWAFGQRWVAKGFSGCWGMSGCQRPILHRKQDAAEHPQLSQAAASPKEQSAHGEQGSPAQNRTERNKCSPITSPLIGLWIPASMDEQISRGKRAQPGVQHPPAPAQSASREYTHPHTLLQAPHAPSPQHSTPLQMSPKATLVWGHWPGGAESHLLGAKLLPSCQRWGQDRCKCPSLRGPPCTVGHLS